MKILFVGDVHAKVEDLEDCEALRAYVFGIAQEHKPDLIVFLGDQYDSHAIKHVEVELFWIRVLTELKFHGFEVVCLLGNHDRPGNAASVAHSMQVHLPYAHVVDRANPFIDRSILFLPYFHDPVNLVKAAQEHPDAKLLVCHAAFKGGKWDNGYPIDGGGMYLGKEVADPADLPQTTIVSGHIHTPARFGKVWYPGSPRWQTQNDANISRSIWLMSWDGQVLETAQEFSTDKVCRRVWQLDYTPEDRCEKEIPLIGPKDRVLFNLRGTLAFCEEAKRNLASKGFTQVRAFPTDRGVAKVAESKGVEVAFADHVSAYRPKFGTPASRLKEMLRERLSV